jgi:hypothetical protein
VVGRKCQRVVYFEAPRLEHSEKPEPFYDIVRAGRIRHTVKRSSASPAGLPLRAPFASTVATIAHQFFLFCIEAPVDCHV